MITAIHRAEIFKSSFLKSVFKVIQQRELEDYAVTEENKYLFDLLNSKDFKFFQNYPNPFNLTTVITYTLLSDGEVL